MNGGSRGRAGPVGPSELVLGRIYRDEEGLAWAVLGRNRRSAVLLTAPEDVPDWRGVLVEPDGAWYEEDRFTGVVEPLVPTGEAASCRSCGAALVAWPPGAPANHATGCAWLTLAVRAVTRGIASPSGRWLRAPDLADLAPPGRPARPEGSS